MPGEIITEFEQGLFYKYEPGVTQVVHIKNKTLKEHQTIGQKMVGETFPSGKIWFVQGNEDLSKYTEITEAEFDAYIEGFGA